MNPIYAEQKRIAEAVFGEGYYAKTWRSLPWYTRLYWTIRGYNPGGRKGAPAL